MNFLKKDPILIEIKVKNIDEANKFMTVLFFLNILFHSQFIISYILMNRRPWTLEVKSIIILGGRMHKKVSVKVWNKELDVNCRKS